MMLLNCNFLCHIPAAIIIIVVVSECGQAGVLLLFFLMIRSRMLAWKGRFVARGGSGLEPASSEAERVHRTGRHAMGSVDI